MNPPHPPPATVGASPIQSVLLVSRFQNKGGSFRATSRPGHLIHAVISGCVRQRCNGREYVLGPRSGIWYHEDELVTGTVLEAPWVFYSVNFIAPCLPPPTFESRFYPSVHPTIHRCFKQLLRDWNDASLPATVREFRVHANLLEILSSLHAPPRRPIRMDSRAQLWWEIETRARQRLDAPVTLQTMEEWTHRSAATIARSCEHAVGVPPMKRVKQIRMSLARGLVRASSTSIKEIAQRLGYERVHEFSRDYRKHHGLAAREDRNIGSPRAP